MQNSMLCHVQQFQGLPRNVSFDIDALEAIWFAIRVLWNGRNKMIFKMVDVHIQDLVEKDKFTSW